MGLELLRRSSQGVDQLKQVQVQEKVWCFWEQAVFPSPRETYSSHVCPTGLNVYGTSHPLSYSESQKF